MDHFVYHERLTGSTVSILHSKTTLVVCPECILSQWKEQLEEHAPQLTFAVYDAKKLGTGCDDVGAELDRVRRRCESRLCPARGGEMGIRTGPFFWVGVGGVWLCVSHSVTHGE